MYVPIQVIKDYVAICLRYENHISNSKYVVMEMMTKRRHPDHLKVRWSCCLRRHLAATCAFEWGLTVGRRWWTSQLPAAGQAHH